MLKATEELLWTEAAHEFNINVRTLQWFAVIKAFDFEDIKKSSTCFWVFSSSYVQLLKDTHTHTHTHIHTHSWDKKLYIWEMCHFSQISDCVPLLLIHSSENTNFSKETGTYADTHTAFKALKTCEKWPDASSRTNQSQVTLCCYWGVSKALIRSAYAC